MKIFFSVLSAGAWLLIKNWSTRCAILRHWAWWRIYYLCSAHGCIYLLVLRSKQTNPEGVERKERMRSKSEYRHVLLQGLLASCQVWSLTCWAGPVLPFLSFSSHLSLFITIHVTGESWLTSNVHRRASASAASGNQYIMIPCPSPTPPPPQTPTKQLKIMP